VAKEGSKQGESGGQRFRPTCFPIKTLWTGGYQKREVDGGDRHANKKGPWHNGPLSKSTIRTGWGGARGDLFSLQRPCRGGGYRTKAKTKTARLLPGGQLEIGVWGTGTKGVIARANRGKKKGGMRLHKMAVMNQEFFHIVTEKKLL